MVNMRVIKKETGKNAEVVEIENELQSFQEIINGFLEPVYFTVKNKRYVLICDDFGKGNYTVPNIHIEFVDGTKDWIAGTLLISKVDDDEFASVDQEDLEFLLQQLNSGLLKIV